jgi:isoquinoline 1-oxidoreductase alpha subunit
LGALVTLRDRPLVGRWRIAPAEFQSAPIKKRPARLHGSPVFRRGAWALSPSFLIRTGRFTVAKLNVNGRVIDVEAAGDTPLLWVIREQIGLTGTKYGCGVAQCGACTVHIDGVATRSCALPLDAVTAEQKIVTIEGLSPDGSHPVQQAWIKHDVPQCGFCQSGMIMATAALLQANPKATEADIAAEITNICRCGTYARVKTAILDVVAGGTLGRG